jgi:hypothetical protein
LKSKLLIPGWAGKVDECEAEYIAEKLYVDRQLWLKWRKVLKKVGYSRAVRRPSIKAIKKWVWDLKSIDIG